MKESEFGLIRFPTASHWTLRSRRRRFTRKKETHEVQDETASEGKKIISTEKAPKAIGPYSQAICIEGLIFTAGEVGLDPATMELVEGGIDAETRQALTNLGHVLEAADSGMNFVVKTTVFLKEIADFAAMNAVYAEFFPGKPPARSTVHVAGLPRGALVEIECIAFLNPGRGD